MEQPSGPDTTAPSDTTAAAFQAAGIAVTPEGIAEAGRRLRRARERWTPELDRQLREQLGLPARAA